MRMARIIVCGGPGAGKTQLAEELSRKDCIRVYHTDDLNALDWKDQSLVVSRWLDRGAPWIIEGVTAARGLRKWLKANEEGLPADIIYWVDRCFEKLEPGAESLRKGTKTIWSGIYPELMRRNADVRMIF